MMASGRNRRSGTAVPSSIREATSTVPPSPANREENGDVVTSPQRDRDQPWACGEAA